MKILPIAAERSPQSSARRARLFTGSTDRAIPKPYAPFSIARMLPRGARLLRQERRPGIGRRRTTKHEPERVGPGLAALLVRVDSVLLPLHLDVAGVEEGARRDVF